MKLQYKMRLYDDKWFALGIYYGYPICCIDQFTRNTCSQTKAQYPDAPWFGTGFIPCLDCAEKIGVDFTRFVNETITPNRIAEIPFPSPYDSPFDDLSKLVKHIETHLAKIAA